MEETHDTEAALVAGNGQPPGAIDPAVLSGPFIHWPSFFEKDRSEPEWVVQDVLARRRGHSIWAKGGTGKSEFMQWVALQAIGGGHVVVYLDYEMIDDDVYDRMVDFGCGPDELGRLYYALIPDLPPLDTPAGAKVLGSWVDEVQSLNPERHVVCMIDTIGRAVVGPENDNDTIMAFYRHSGHALKIRGTTWARLDHTGHAGEHARGGSAKADDVDVVWKLERTDSGCKLRADKRRSSWMPEAVDFDRHETPNLRYVPVPFSWPAGTTEVVELLEGLGVPVEASSREAQKALKDAGHGKRRTVVIAAQKLRASRAGTTPGTTLSGSHGNQPGTTPPDPAAQATEPPPEPPGTTSGDMVGTSGVPLKGTTVPPSVPVSLTEEEIAENEEYAQRHRGATEPPVPGGVE